MSGEKVEDHFAIKGGGESGIFTAMSEVLKTKEQSGGSFAMFSSIQEEEEYNFYVRPEESFIVWVGRQVGLCHNYTIVVCESNSTTGRREDVWSDVANSLDKRQKSGRR